MLDIQKSLTELSGSKCSDSAQYPVMVIVYHILIPQIAPSQNKLGVKLG